MLVPKGVDPSARGAKLPVPDPRPSEKIAKLFPQTDPAKLSAAVAQGKSETVAVANPVPLPVPRPAIEPVQEPRRPVKNRSHRQQ